MSEFFTILSFRMKRGEICPTTYNNYLRHLKAFFNWCVAEGMIERSPVGTRKRLPQNGRVIDYSSEDIQAIITTMERSQVREGRIPLWHRDRALLILQLETGLRPSEALSLLVTDMDWNSSVVLVRPEVAKTDRPRHVPFPLAAQRAVESWLKIRNKYLPNLDQKIAVFCSESGRRLDARSWQQQLTRYCKRASKLAERDIHIFPYGIRHHFAITYLRNGGPAFKLRGYLGHTTERMMNNYINLARSDVEEDAEAYSTTRGLKISFR